MENIEVFKEYLPFLIPLVIIQLGFQVAALVHLLKNPNYRFGNKTFWILVVVLGQLVGPIIYFIFGREE